MNQSAALFVVALISCAVACTGGGHDDSTGSGSEDVVGGLKGCGVIHGGQGITTGESFSSCNGRFTLVMQTDGNLVLYANPGAALWSTNTNAGRVAVMQADGNFVVYAEGSAPLWASNTGGTMADVLAVQDDGNLVVYRNGAPLWSSNTCTGCRPLTRAELEDYYVQDVCLDGAGQTTADDPFGCSTKRNVALDEPVRFLLHDTADAAYPVGHQATVSVPMRLGPANNGSVGVLHTFDFGGDSNAFLEYQPKSGNISAVSPKSGFPSDGWDVMEHNGGSASYIGTADGGGGIQSWVHGGSCAYDDAWLLWNQDRVVYAPASANAIASLTNGFSSCPPSASSAFTWWAVYPNAVFTSGKTMDTLKTHHFDNASVARATSYEVDYYTRAYGRTRWEAWSRKQTAFTGNCKGDATDGQGFFRNDCRDWSSGSAIPDDGWFPATWPVYYSHAKGNWLVNGDFGSGTSNFAADGGSSRWGSVNSPSWALEQESPGAASLHQGNRFLSATSTATVGSLYQDVPANGAKNGWWFTYGARVWSDTANVPATLRVWRLRADGSSAGFSDVAITATSSRAMHRGAFMVDTDDITRLRVEIYFSTLGARYHVDDVFLTQT